MNTEPPDLSRALPSGEHRACLGLGSNVDPVSNLRRAIRRLRRAVAVEAVSTAWESPAVGRRMAPTISTPRSWSAPRSRKSGWWPRLKEIENELGRLRNHGRPARLTIDIDMLVFDREFLEDDLWSQAYRAVPVAELLPDLCCPLTGESLSHAATASPARSPITPRPEILAGSHRTGTSRTNPTSSTSDPDSMTNQTVSPESQPAEATSPHAPRVYKYYDLLMVAFVTVLICSNFIAAGKVARIGSVEFGAGVVFFPLELPLWRHSHRGLRLRPIAEGDLGRVYGAWSSQPS